MSTSDMPPSVCGCVLYDSSCGFCRQWSAFWSATLRRHGYSLAPLQSTWVRQQLGLREEELLQDLRLLLPDGTQVQGADVYRHVMRRIWWSYPFYLLASAPVLRGLFDLGYRTFADNRFRFSRGLAGQPHVPASAGAEVNIPDRESTLGKNDGVV